MARIVSIFQFTGRAGSAVGSKGKGGKILLRQYQPTVANPRTQAQMSHRAKMKLAAQVAGMLGEVGRTALIANGLRKTERGRLIKQLLQAVKVSADGTKASLGYVKHHVVMNALPAWLLNALMVPFSVVILHELLNSLPQLNGVITS